MDGQSKFLGCWRDTIVVPTIFFGMSVRPKMVRMSFTKILLEKSQKKSEKNHVRLCNRWTDKNCAGQLVPLFTLNGRTVGQGFYSLTPGNKAKLIEILQQALVLHKPWFVVETYLKDQ